MRKSIEELFESSENTNSIATHAGVPQSTVHRYRTGERKLDNMPLATAEKLQKFWEEYNMKNIKWTGKTTDGNKKYTAEGSTYEEVYNHINEKYGYGSILDDEEEDRTDWTEEDYRDAIEESTSEAYYHEFKMTVE